ncbi:MAG: class I tRNA ligase family protein [bacterium]|nr:class I tRNA ligase family protein [bacterium]
MLRGLKDFNLSDIEEKVLKFWKDNNIFEKSVALRKAQDGKTKFFRFFEGPPTANGLPHIGHAEGRAFKDVIPRFKSMQGYLVERKAGWDTHGLPVEIEVEKELGLKNKQDIEKFGIAEFNERAKASTWKYKEEWEKMTDRLGFWIDLKNPYVTYDARYIESLWWVFKEISKRKLLTQSFKIVPWCPRCQTALSSHELSQGYKKVKDPSIYVQFKVSKSRKSLGFARDKSKSNEYFLIWTTTPWTLPANVAVAVDPKATYTKYKIGDDFVWALALPAGMSDGVETIEKISGKKLVGIAYEPLYEVRGPWLKNKKFFKVYAADFIKKGEGTGFVHIAPAFGEDDMRLMKKVVGNLVGEIPITIDDGGIVQRGLPGAGMFAKKADVHIIADLEKRGLLLKQDIIEHDYPFCWRCDTPLLYKARFSWFIEMSKLRDELLENNKKINWVPEHIKEGRFGEWLKNIDDWAVSRDRYWGTPLPIWQCEKCDAHIVVGSLKELDELGTKKNNFWILRHGEADHNINGTAAGPEKGKKPSLLTALGVLQIETAAQKLIKQLGKKKLDIIIASPYQRTQDVSKIVARKTGTTIITDDRLQDIDSGIFSGKPLEHYDAFFNNPLERFTKAPENGETLTSVKKRMIAAILDINKKYSNKNILIVSHADPIWILKGALQNMTHAEMIDLPSIGLGELQALKVPHWPYNPTTGEVDMHRPYVDDIHLVCEKCKGTMKRVPEVADVWFDSGAMPYAQWHYPFEHKDLVDKKIAFPADYISEGIDQTRGWFYTLLAISTALGKGAPYLNVITQGHILDKNGKKMSKSKGNAVSPGELIAKYGADTLRWYFYTQTTPGEPKSFDEQDLGKTLRKVFMILYNSFVFLDTYGIQKIQDARKIQYENILDQWISAELQKLIKTVTVSLEAYDVTNAGRMIETFVDDLSRWYIRRSRRRFQKPESEKDLGEASALLRHIFIEVSKLMAPFTPFFSEALYRSVDSGHETGDMGLSVHLEDWPKADGGINGELIKKMAEVRRLASLALGLRAEKGVKVRQPLSKIMIKTNILNDSDTALLGILSDEVNVKSVVIAPKQNEEIIFDFTITPKLKSEGMMREFVRMVQGMRQDAKLVPHDRIVVMIQASEIMQTVLQAEESIFKKEVGATAVEFKQSDKFDASLDSKIDGESVWVGIRKV